jgi:hypothetical protein
VQSHDLGDDREAETGPLAARFVCERLQPKGHVLIRQARPVVVDREAYAGSTRHRALTPGSRVPHGVIDELGHRLRDQGRADDSGALWQCTHADADVPLSRLRLHISHHGIGNRAQIDRLGIDGRQASQARIVAEAGKAIANRRYLSLDAARCAVGYAVQLQDRDRQGRAQMVQRASEEDFLGYARVPAAWLGAGSATAPVRTPLRRAHDATASIM